MLHAAVGAVGDTQRFREVVKEWRRVGSGTADEGSVVSADSVGLNMYVNVGRMSKSMLIQGSRAHVRDSESFTAAEIVNGINDGLGGAGTTKFRPANLGTNCN